MRTVIAIVVLAAAMGGRVSAQEVWEQLELAPEGMEYRLTNDDGASIILVCQNDGVVAGFEFPEPLENPERATVRSIPGQRENVPVLPVTDRIVRITGKGIVTAMSLIREAAAFHVRVRGASAMFSTSGSRHIVDGCFARQEARFGGAITPGDRAIWGNSSGNALDPR